MNAGFLKCEHLRPLEKEIQATGIKETFRGQAWTDNCREWVYFDCYLDVEKIRERFQLPLFVETHVNEDPKSGYEEGLVCSQCKDGIMGYHRIYNAGRDVILFA